MADNVQKIPISDSAPPFALQRAYDATQELGKALPCSVVSVAGAIVTVKFEVQDLHTLPDVTVPLFGPEYIRYPIQKGDLGVVFPADTYLGGVSGLGGGVAGLSRRGNLTALVFFPIGNRTWSAVDPNTVTVYGPNGVVLRDSTSNTTAMLHPSSYAVQSIGGSISFTASGHTLVINSSGVTIDGVLFAPHYHSGVQTGGGDTGPVAG